jgi:5-hydroxyisourate hydrolase
MGRLTTHVLDTALGKPAAQVPIQLFRVDRQQGTRVLVTETNTNGDGRTDSPLLVNESFVVGTYELVFHVGRYFSYVERAAASVPFYDHITVRVTLASGSEHYHVPLLVSPWSYSTYRGS